MFTGIVTDVAPVIKSHQDKGGLTLTLKKPVGWGDLELGESIATNGVCLTVSAIREDEYDMFLMPETLEVAAFGASVPKEVNLERSLSAKDRFGGHFVQGHVDGVGEVVSVEPGSDYRLSVAFTASSDLLEALNPEPVSGESQEAMLQRKERMVRGLIMYKGSITINGVSLTVAGVSDNVLTVALIPHTLEHTTLDSLKVGDKVNLEFDMIGKYIANILDKKALDQPAKHEALAASRGDKLAKQEIERAKS